MWKLPALKSEQQIEFKNTYEIVLGKTEPVCQQPVSYLW